MRSVLIAGPKLVDQAMALAVDRALALHPFKPYAEPDELISAANAIEAEALIPRMGRITADVINSIPTLRVIVKHGVGVDGVDVAAATARGIPVLIAGGTNSLSVAEHALALLMSVARSTALLDARMRQGHWDKASSTGFEITGKALGIIGLGAIGRAFVHLLAPFGLTVRLYDPYLPADAVPDGITTVDNPEEIWATSDIISLHCPLTEANRHLINAGALAQMKPNAVIINTARGELIDEMALMEALRDGRIAGAGLDTFSSEPVAVESPLWHVPNLVATPHIGANTHEARLRMGDSVVTQIANYLDDGSIERPNLFNKAILETAEA